MNAPARTAANMPNPCLARQPILSADEKVFGYELLYRESPEEHRFTSDPDSATCDTIETLNVLGFDAVCDGHLAFINCTHEMLMRELFFLLPPEKVVVEIQEKVTAEEEVVAATRELKRKNYKIALANCIPGDPREPLIQYADFIKVDVLKCLPEQRVAMVAKHASTRCWMVAHKVESRLQQVIAVKEGFTFFQGYFFRRPERMRARHIQGNQASYLRLLQAIAAPQVDFAVVEDLIKRDASLCYRLLRYLNSPLIGISAPVQSIRHAMNLIGERELIRWIRMTITLTCGQDKCSDLVLSSLVRARFCELIAPKVSRSKSDLFLVGMLSLMDAILEVPMGMVVEGLALDEDTKAELLGAKKGSDTPLTPIYRLMLAREMGEWEDVTTLAKTLDLSLPFVNHTYNEAMRWAREMTSGDFAQNH